MSAVRQLTVVDLSVRIQGLHPEEHLVRLRPAICRIRQEELRPRPDRWRGCFLAPL